MAGGLSTARGPVLAGRRGRIDGETSGDTPLRIASSLYQKHNSRVKVHMFSAERVGRTHPRSSTQASSRISFGRLSEPRGRACGSSACSWSRHAGPAVLAGRTSDPLRAESSAVEPRTAQPGRTPARVRTSREHGMCPASARARQAFALQTTDLVDLQGIPRSPLTDSNRRPPPYHPGTDAGSAGTAGSPRPRKRRKPKKSDADE